MNAGRPSQLTGRSRLGALSAQLAGTAEKMETERAKIAALKDSAALVVSSFNLFPTPEPIADMMADLFDGFGRVLEPSAGTGRLYQAVRRLDPTCEIDLIDISPECCRVLRGIREAMGDEAGANITQADFLTMPVRDLYDSIIMNPPFKNGVDVRHVKHALSMLKPGGRLVSLVANGPRQRAGLEQIADEWIDLPAGSFKGEGTNVAVAIVVIDKPH